MNSWDNVEYNFKLLLECAGNQTHKSERPLGYVIICAWYEVGT